MSDAVEYLREWAGVWSTLKASKRVKELLDQHDALAKRAEELERTSRCLLKYTEHLSGCATKYGRDNCNCGLMRDLAALNAKEPA